MNRIFDLWFKLPLMDVDGSAGGGAGGADAGTGEGDGGDSNAGAGGGDSQGGKEKIFTQADLDRIISDRLAKAKDKFKQELETEKSEAARLAKLSAEERTKEQFKKDQERFESDKAAFEKERMELETTKLLASEKLPVEFAKFLMSDTAEKTTAYVTEFKKAFGAAIEVAVTDRLKGGAPKNGEKPQNVPVDFRDAIKGALYSAK